jgi:mono/diheme cytochrome c family protein
MYAMKRMSRSRFLSLVLCLILVLGVATLAVAMSEDLKKGKKKGANKAQAQMEAYQLYEQKCLGCHDSIADPERPGKTRDGWTVTVKYMDKHYVDLNDAEAQKIIDLLFALRRGLERDPG